MGFLHGTGGYISFILHIPSLHKICIYIERLQTFFLSFFLSFFLRFYRCIHGILSVDWISLRARVLRWMARCVLFIWLVLGTLNKNCIPPKSSNKHLGGEKTPFCVCRFLRFTVDDTVVLSGLQFTRCTSTHRSSRETAHTKNFTLKTRCKVLYHHHDFNVLPPFMCL